MKRKKELEQVYTLRPETLVSMLLDQWIRGYIICALEDEPGEPSPVPMDRGGPQTKAWIDNLASELLTMKRRKDGTHYMPQKRMID